MDSSKVTGHYTSMIQPSFDYVGLGDFYTEAARYPNTTSGEFCSGSDLEETMLDAPANVMQKIEISNKFIDSYILEGDTSIYTDQTATLTPMVLLKRNNATRKLWLLDDMTFSSSDPDTASVSKDGQITGHKDGTVTITVSSSGQVITSAQITVKCNHTRTLLSHKPATCTTPGESVFHCNICNNDIHQTIPVIPHSYVYGDPDDSGKCTGVCSVCHDTISIIPPTDMTVYWRSGDSTSYQYSTRLPSDIRVGSTLECWPSIGSGDNSYRDVVITSSNESVISVPENITVNSPSNVLKVLSPGITQITVSPKYNAQLEQTYTVRAGDNGSVDISNMSVILSQDIFTYDGNPCTPEATVSQLTTPLVKNVDYTISYENNISAGTATVVITGKGLFTGVLRKSFTIRSTDTTEHTHKEVIDPAIAATCTNFGTTKGSHCSICGEILTPQEIIPALGHDYVNGTCSRCGDVQYIDQSGLRYTLSTDVNGNTLASVKAQPDASLNGKVKIPSTISVNGTDYTITAIGDNAFAGQDQLTSLTIPKTVTSLGDSIFSGCSSLTTITFQCNAAPKDTDHTWDNLGVDKLSFIAPSVGGSYTALAEHTGADVTITRTPLPDHEHELIHHAAVPSTCENGGSIEYYECKDPDCGNLYLDADATQQIYPADIHTLALGHNWANTFTIDKAATATTAGEESIHCLRCDARSRITAIPAGSAQPTATPVPGSNTGGSSSKNNSSANSSGNSSSGSSSTNSVILRKGSTFKSNGLRYKVTSAATGRSTVTCLGPISRNIRQVSIPASVTRNGKRYQVTVIAKNAFSQCTRLQKAVVGKSVAKIGAKAFYNCKTLQSVTIRNPKLKKKGIGTQAFGKCPKVRLRYK